MNKKYHHGDLAAAALNESVKILESDGLAGLTLRGIAQRLSVDHKALYQHFKNKEALVGAIAAEGYRTLAKGQYAAIKRAKNPLGGLRALGRAYVSFCVQNVALSEAMHGGTGLNLDGAYPPLREAHDQALSALFDAVAKAQSEGLVIPGPAEHIALALWTFCHGYVDSYRLQQGFFGARFRPPVSKSGIAQHFDRAFKHILLGFRSKD